MDLYRGKMTQRAAHAALQIVQKLKSIDHSKQKSDICAFWPHLIGDPAGTMECRSKKIELHITGLAIHLYVYLRPPKGYIIIREKKILIPITISDFLHYWTKTKL